jgi:predicted nucleic acid-binding protein
MSTIVLDTSVLVHDFRLRGVLFRAVLRTVQDLRDHIYIPKLVIDELINKFREELQSSYDALHSHEDKIIKLTNSSFRKRRVEVPEQVALYSAWLQSELSRNNIQSLDYPRISHESLVKRALARRKPFCPEGQRGYRDAVLWETILQRYQVDREEIFFVSRNTRDFADPGNSSKLHLHLIEDLRLLNHDESSVQFFPGFEDLLARALSPRQRLFPELDQQVKEGRLGQRKLVPWLISILPGILNKIDFNSVPYSILFRKGRLSHKELAIGKIHRIARLSLNSTSRLTERTILLILSLEFSADVLLKQPELLLEDVSESRIIEFIGFVAIEVELETSDIVSVEVNMVIPIDEWIYNA